MPRGTVVDDLGLVSEMKDQVWQYVDWSDIWNADPENGHSDKGVPTAGRKINRHKLQHALRLRAKANT